MKGDDLLRKELPGRLAHEVVVLVEDAARANVRQLLGHDRLGPQAHAAGQPGGKGRGIKGKGLHQCARGGCACV